ncbi:MAG: nuclear transport factor 2 family protein [Gaiellaceae bacterium MAG52_C11]|nr:nuclear transport factor 2 family protein [Candidatus Gaiellasilicea maunaloa]
MRTIVRIANMKAAMELTAAIRELEDRQAIAELIHAYCDHFDRNEPEAVAALFTKDATLDYGPEAATIVGSDAIAATIAVGLEQTFAATSHHVSNVRISFDAPDAARGVTYLYAWHRYRDGSPDGQLWGRYRHRFERTTAGWRIAELVLEAAGTIDFHRATMHPIGRRQGSAAPGR